MMPPTHSSIIRRVLGPVLATILIVGCVSQSASQQAATQGNKVCELLRDSPSAGLNRAAQSAVGLARARLGVTTVVRAGIAPSVGPFLNGHCALILAPGYQQAPQILATASKFLRQRFLLADDWFNFSSAPDLTRPNVSVLAFEADQASFLAGYIAAAVSPAHVVGEYGSVNTPTVDLALNGFLAGARAYGQDFRTHVRILGWNGTRGEFIGNDFDKQQAFSITSALIRRGAHVIFGVAGNAVLGSAAAAAAHRDVYLIGMYTDGYQVAPRYGGIWLTSVMFNMRSPVLAAITAATRGRFSGGLYVGTLANGGVALASFHRLGHLVPRPLLARLRSLRTGLEQGWVSTNPADYVPLEKPDGPNSNG